MLLSTKGSEDVSNLLEIDKPSYELKRINDVVIRKPDEKVYWIIDIDFHGFTKNDEEIIDVFPYTVKYGLIAGLNEWTSIGRGKEVLSYSKIAICKTIFNNVDYEIKETEDSLNEYLQMITELANKLGPVTVKPRISVQNALKKAQNIYDFYLSESEYDHDIVVVLDSQRKHFSGDKVWDVMSSLGIEWGDMDIFHLKNHNFDGDQDLFSVWSSSGYGCFFPEDIENRNVKVKDLIFGFTISRTYYPSDVFKAMMKAVEYAQKRLGGVILDNAGKRLEKNDISNKIEEAELRFERAGFKTGDHMSLYLF